MDALAGATHYFVDLLDPLSGSRPSGLRPEPLRVGDGGGTPVRLSVTMTESPTVQSTTRPGLEPALTMGGVSMWMVFVDVSGTAAARGRWEMPTSRRQPEAR